jgi:hypothetical protein
MWLHKNLWVRKCSYKGTYMPVTMFNLMVKKSMGLHRDVWTHGFKLCS